MKKQTITGYLAALTFLLAAVALQLYFNKDYYFAMNRAKCSFTMIVLMGAVLTALVRPIERIWTRQEKQKMTLLDWSVLAFGCFSLVTCCLSKYIDLTFIGSKGMFVGAFSYFTGMLVYFVVSRNLMPKKWLVWTLTAGWALIFGWTLLNQCGVDFFGMHNGIKPGDAIVYVSSLGNVNSASVAFAALVPFVVLLSVFGADFMNRRLMLAVSLLGLMASYTLGSEGVLIGLLAMMPFVVVAALSGPEKTGRALKWLLLLGLSVMLYHILCLGHIAKGTSGLAYTLANYGLGEMLTALTLILILFYLKSHSALRSDEKAVRKIRQAVAWTCAAVLVGFVAFSVAKSFHDPNYASTRGAIWKGNIWTFRLYKPIEMVFGQGSGMFAKNATLAHTMLMGEEKSTVTFATSHDILLQALMSNGIVGLLCLLTGLFALLRDWFRDLRPLVLRPASEAQPTFEEVIRVASFVAIMGFFGASLVESTYPHTTILLFALLALYRSSYFVPRKKKL